MALHHDTIRAHFFFTDIKKKEATSQLATLPPRSRIRLILLEVFSLRQSCLCLIGLNETVILSMALHHDSIRVHIFITDIKKGEATSRLATLPPCSPNRSPPLGSCFPSGKFVFNRPEQDCISVDSTALWRHSCAFLHQTWKTKKQCQNFCHHILTLDHLLSEVVSLSQICLFLINLNKTIFLSMAFLRY